MGDAVDWLRNNNPDVRKVDKPMLKALTKIAGFSMPKKLTPATYKRSMDDFVEWLRNNDLSPEHVDEATLKALTKLAGVSMPSNVLSPDEQRSKAIQDSLDWLRNNDPKLSS